MDRELGSRLLERGMTAVGVLGTLLAVVAQGRSWLVPSCWALLAAFGGFWIADAVYRWIPIWIPWRTVRLGVSALIEKLSASGWVPDVVVGAGRAGSIVGATIAANMGHRTFVALDVKHTDNPRRAIVGGPIRLTSTGLSEKRVLVVFAYIDKGETAKAVFDYLRNNGLDPESVACATLFLDPEAEKPDGIQGRCFYSAFKRRISKQRWSATPWYISKEYDYR